MSNDVEAEFEDLLRRAYEGGGASRRREGALSARERIDLLCDVGSFRELDAFVTHDVEGFGLADRKFPGDGAITGTATIHDRPVCVYAGDWTVLKGTWGRQHGEKVARLYELARRTGVPVISLYESAGARLQELLHAMEAGAHQGRALSAMAGLVPTIGAIMGTCIGLPAVSAVHSNFLFMLRDRSSLCFAGATVVAQATGEEVTEQELGGTAVHIDNGTATSAFDDERELLRHIRLLLEFLPSNNATPAPTVPTQDPPRRKVRELEQLMPIGRFEPYDVKPVITALVDDGRFLELHEEFAPNLVVGFGRFDGQTVGIAANQPKVLAGAFNVKAARKLTRFVNYLHAFGIPLISLIDVPGVLPGKEETHRGSLPHAAIAVDALVRLSAPKITVITHRCFGGTWTLANSKALDGDLLYAYPHAEIGPMSAEALAHVVTRGNADPAMVEMIRREHCSAIAAAKKGFIHGIIRPAETRAVICDGLRALRTKRRTDRDPRRIHTIPL